jgi:hypothetical protein
LQVWYSAAWSSATLAAFRAALSDLLSPQGPQLPATVLAFLQHWQLHDNVPLAASRQQWLETMKGDHADEIGNFKELEDRMAMCSYVLTGQLLEADVGSVVMFSLPTREDEKALNELFLQVRIFAMCVQHDGFYEYDWLASVC